jgi:ATP-binding cassette, subfamily B, bacterial MsbA
VVVIAHRLSTVRRANRIAVLEDGRITAIGSHDELLLNSPTYLRLYQLQFMDVAENGATGDHGLEQPEPETPQSRNFLEPAVSGEVED